jgi:D-glycero-D-manno-heptose 1,7-bisphosphate phosphatase
MQQAIFLDRDGTLNRDTHYLIHFRDFELLPDVLPALKIMQGLGYALFVVSNQSGVARGYFHLNQVMELNWRIRDFFASEGINFKDMVICPHHPEGKVSPYNRPCHCRKPKPGMIQAMVKRYHLNMSGSYMVGDRLLDAQAGQAAGVEGILIGTRNAENVTPVTSRIDIRPEFREFASLLAFAQSLSPADSQASHQAAYPQAL